MEHRSTSPLISARASENGNQRKTRHLPGQLPPESENPLLDHFMVPGVELFHDDPYTKVRTPRPGWLNSVVLLGLTLCGCASPAARNASFARPFTFGEDTFAYRNDLVWTYYHDPETGKFRHKPRKPKPDYTHHCFPVARSARQFFQHARFDPTQPVADDATYRKLIRRVATTSPRTWLEEQQKIVIPGYTNLFQFSQAHERLLKEECGGAYQSYFQRGHWRMIFWFSGAQQEAMVQQLRESIARNRPPVIHISRFPSLTINHALVLFGVTETPEEVRFSAYDPYDPTKPVPLTFNRKERQFYYPENDYFVGGKADVYEIYYSWKY